MTRTDRLLFGPHGCGTPCSGPVGLPAMVPGYNPMFQTVTAFTVVDRHPGEFERSGSAERLLAVRTACLRLVHRMPSVFGILWSIGTGVWLRLREQSDRNR
jgi:hypothetical protein